MFPRVRPSVVTMRSRSRCSTAAGRFRTPPLDIGNKVGGYCLVGMQVQNGEFVRVSPTEPGTFDCGGDKPPIELTIDPVKEYRG